MSQIFANRDTKSGILPKKILEPKRLWGRIAIAEPFTVKLK
ncbi:hypothetical protein NX862_15425 [Rhodobacter sp. KR11]|nr:hypothetical protein [Rhodobacter sp. KR11]